jgi:hypothetical protein
LYIKSIRIENLRCFQQAELEFQYPGKVNNDGAPKWPNVNLLLGNNGKGKTSILKAVALAVLSPIMPQSGYLPYRLVRRTGGKSPQPTEANIEAEVLLHAQDLLVEKLKEPRGEQVSIQIIRNEDVEIMTSGAAPTHGHSGKSGGVWECMFSNKSPAFLVVGYGASRRVEDARSFDEAARSKTRLLRYERVAGLFEGQVSLRPLIQWLPSFSTENPGRHKQIVNLINRLLPEGALFEGKHEEGDYLFEVNGVPTPLGALSDGYRAYIGWITDLLYHICMGAPSGAKLVDNYGIVLVDEIDLHLHPEWQRVVVETLARALPNIQFVFTTHSPIVAGSLNKENIYVTDGDSSGASVVRQYDERIYGLDAEEVLLSSYFNLKTTRAAGFTDELRELSTQAGHGDIKAALSLMEKMSGQKIAGGNGDGELVVPRPRAGKEAAAVASRFELVAQAMGAEQSGARLSAVNAAVGAAKGSTALTGWGARRPSKSLKAAAKKSGAKKGGARKAAAKKSAGKKAGAKKSGGRR